MRLTVACACDHSLDILLYEHKHIPQNHLPSPNILIELVVDKILESKSSMAHHETGQPSSTKVERKIKEKNRRNHMKNLCFKLNSLLPNFNPRETLPRAEQIDEAINYIKSLEARVKMAEEKKESLLMGRKRSRRCCSSAFETQGSLKPPTIEIHEVGFMLEVVLTSGFDNQFIFNEIIRILHEENIEILGANSSLAGDSMLHVVHAENRHFFQLGATRISERLKSFVDGHWQDFQGA